MNTANENTQNLFVPPSERADRARLPFLARSPQVGFAVALVCAAAALFFTWQVISSSPLITADVAAEEAIYAWAKQQPEPVVFLMRALSSYGRDGIALLMLLLTVGWGRKRARRELWFLFMGPLAGEVVFQVLHNLVRRARPEFKDPFENLIGFGFPSGHAITNMLLGLMILYLLLPRIRSRGRRIAFTAAVIITVLLIGFSRLFLGLHYPLDILTGYLIAFAWAGLVFTGIELYFWRKRRTGQPRAAGQ